MNRICNIATSMLLQSSKRNDKKCMYAGKYAIEIMYVFTFKSYWNYLYIGLSTRSQFPFCLLCNKTPHHELRKPITASLITQNHYPSFYIYCWLKVPLVFWFNFYTWNYLETVWQSELLSTGELEDTQLLVFRILLGR